MLMSNSRYYGFTLMELIIVIIVIGALMAMAFPRYEILVEKFRAHEAAQVWLAIYGAEKAYKLDHGHYTKSLADLDIEIRPMKDFEIVGGSLNDPDITRYSSKYWPSGISKTCFGFIRRVGRSCGASYSLSISKYAEISCGSCSDTDICNKIGYPPPTYSDP